MLKRARGTYLLSIKKVYPRKYFTTNNSQHITHNPQLTTQPPTTKKPVSKAASAKAGGTCKVVRQGRAFRFCSRGACAALEAMDRAAREFCPLVREKPCAAKKPFCRQAFWLLLRPKVTAQRQLSGGYADQPYRKHKQKKSPA